MSAEGAPSTRQPYAQVDHDKCMGVSLCVFAAPAAFRLNADGQSEFQPQANATLPELQEATDSCPMAAITIHWK